MPLPVPGNLLHRDDRAVSSRLLFLRHQGPRPHETHLSSEDVPELRQFIHRCRSQDPAHRRHPRIIFFGLSYKLTPVRRLLFVACLLFTLFGLLVATGIRISEALALQVNDYTEDGLLIRETKFHKSRLVPVHETTVCAVDRYLKLREQGSTLDGAR